MDVEIEKLRNLYQKASKHSNYQILPSQLAELFGEKELRVNSRYESERLDYIKTQLSFNEVSVLDIGGNTGFFSFESLKAQASRVIYFEGNEDHASFVRLAAKLLGYEKKIEVINEYFAFNSSQMHNRVDICFLLNILHHVGDDFGDRKMSVCEAKLEILRSLNHMIDYCDILVFQLGFCWMGDRNKLLFNRGTKRELIDYVVNGTESAWEIVSIGIPEIDDSRVIYTSLSNSNITRRDDFGEFLNRPLFIMKRKTII